MSKIHFAAGLLFAVFLFTAVDGAVAQTRDDVGWSFEGEVSGVWVGGNSISRTVGSNALVEYRWARSVYR